MVISASHSARASLVTLTTVPDSRVGSVSSATCFTCARVDAHLVKKLATWWGVFMCVLIFVVALGTFGVHGEANAVPCCNDKFLVIESEAGCVGDDVKPWGC